jgi:hypothetical protein
MMRGIGGEVFVKGILWIVQEGWDALGLTEFGEDEYLAFT